MNNNVWVMGAIFGVIMFQIVLIITTNNLNQEIRQLNQETNQELPKIPLTPVKILIVTAAGFSFGAALTKLIMLCYEKIKEKQN